MSCSKCKVEEKDTGSYSLAKCDKCNTLLCNNCSGLTASEHKGVTLKNRSKGITYFCKNCLQCDTPDTVDTSSLNLTLQKGFEDLEALFNKNEKFNDKLLRYIDAIHKTTTSLKAEQTQILNRQDELANNIGSIRRDIQENVPSVSVTNAKQVEDNDDRFRTLENAYKELRSKYDAQEAEILCLKRDLAKMNATLDSNSKKASPLNLHPEPSTSQTNATDNKVPSQPSAGKICTGPQRSQIKAANPNIGERLAKLSWIYLANLDVSTTPEAIIDALNPDYKPLYICEKLPSKYKNPRSATFKLGVPESLSTFLLNFGQMEYMWTTTKPSL